MIPHTELELGIGYIRDKTITVGNFDFLYLREFSLPTRLAIKVTEINWHKKAEYKGWVDWPEQQEVDTTD